MVPITCPLVKVGGSPTKAAVLVLGKLVVMTVGVLAVMLVAVVVGVTEVVSLTKLVDAAVLLVGELVVMTVVVMRWE